MFTYHTKLVERMIEQTPRALFGVTVVSAVYIWTYLEYVPINYLLIWTFFQILFIIFRFKNVGLLSSFIHDKSINKVAQHTRYFFISMVISSFIWNGAVVLGLIYAPSPYEILALLMIVGVVTGGVLSIASLYYIYIVYFFLMMLPQFFIMLTFSDHIHLSAAAFTTAFMPLIFLLTKSIYDNQLENILVNESLQGSVDELHTLSVTDSLTNTYNRRHFFNMAQSSISLSHRNNTPLSLLMIDIDHFKNVNDLHGHQAGDIVLSSLAQEIKTLTRESDILARMGGEEFAILLYDTSQDGAKIIAQKIRQKIEDKVFMYKEVVIPISVSIGTGELAKDDTSIEALYKEADDNLFRAKEGGRNRVN